MDLVDPDHRAAAAARRRGRGRGRRRGLVAGHVVGRHAVPVGDPAGDRVVRVGAVGQQRAVERAEGAGRGGGAVDGVAGQVGLGVVRPVQRDRAGACRRQQAGGRGGRRRVARAAIAAEQAGHPLGVVDERVAVALVGVDRVVAGLFLGVDGIIEVPLQHGGQQAHVGRALVAAGVRGLDQRQGVREDQVGFGVPGDAVRAALVADVHVQQGARDVAAAVPPRLPVGDVRPVRPAGVDTRAAAHAVHQLRRVLGARAADHAVRLVAARRVVAVVADEQVVAVGVRVVGGAVVGEAVALGPDVLAVVVEVALTVLREAGVQVDVQHAPAVGRVGVGGLDHVPGVGGRRGVGDLQVVVDDGVEGRAEGGGGGGVDAVVVPGGDAFLEARRRRRRGQGVVVRTAAEDDGQGQEPQGERADRGTHPEPPAGVSGDGGASLGGALRTAKRELSRSCEYSVLDRPESGGHRL